MKLNLPIIFVMLLIVFIAGCSGTTDTTTGDTDDSVIRDDIPAAGDDTTDEPILPEPSGDSSDVLLGASDVGTGYIKNVYLKAPYGGQDGVEFFYTGLFTKTGESTLAFRAGYYLDVESAAKGFLDEIEGFQSELNTGYKIQIDTSRNLGTEAALFYEDDSDEYTLVYVKDTNVVSVVGVNLDSSGYVTESKVFEIGRIIEGRLNRFA